MIQTQDGRAPLALVSEEAALQMIFDFLLRLTQEGAALLIVDQFVTRALAMATTAYVMRRGEVVYSGDAQELAESDLFSHYVGN